MAKEIYIGGSAPKYVTTIETINITAGNISAYFTVSNGSYYFAGSGSTFTTNNGGVASSTAKTTLTAKQDMSNITFNYSYSSEANYDKFTLTAAGTVVENAVSGATTTKSYNGTLSAGDSIIFQYTKDGSANGNNDKCTFSDMVIQIQTQEQDGIIDNVARKVTQPYIGVSNIARKVKSGYIGMGGVARECFSGGTPIGELAVGSSVFMNVDGVATEFLVVQQGLPDIVLYDSSCDGTWLLAKDCYVKMAYDTDNYDFSNSDVHTYLNTTFMGLFDQNIQDIIKQVTIVTKAPYGVVTNGVVFETKIFLLSEKELCEESTHAVTEGLTVTSGVLGDATLDYFVGASNTQRVAYFNGSASNYFTRTGRSGYDTSIYIISSSGAISGASWSIKDVMGVRPVLILPPEIQIDENFNVIA